MTEAIITAPKPPRSQDELDDDLLRIIEMEASDLSLSLAQQYLQIGANPNAVNEVNERPLYKAILRNNRLMVDLLLAHGADINSRAGNGSPPIMATLLDDNAELTRYLISRGADPNLPQQESGFTPLMLATQYNAQAVMNFLLEHGANLHARTENGMDAVMLCCVLRYSTGQAAPLLLEKLIAAGANLKNQNVRGATALMMAAEKGYADLLQILLRAGADANHQAGGATALMLAARNGHLGCVELLIAHGADTGRKSYTGYTAAALAKKHGHRPVVELLAKHQRPWWQGWFS